MNLPILAAALLLSATAAQAAATPRGQAPQGPATREASIPFVNHNGIRDWKAVGSDTLYVQDARRTWYRASLFGPCLDLPFAQTIGFETRGIDRFDRFSSIVVRGQRCSVQSLVRSDPPPAKARHARS